jgi:Holliday junction resolvasome RuvABC endonuclease subunit
VSSWKLASVGRGNATKHDVAEWVQTTYSITPDNQDQCDAIGIAHAGAAWWASREEAA